MLTAKVCSSACMPIDLIAHAPACCNPARISLDARRLAIRINCSPASEHARHASLHARHPARPLVFLLSCLNVPLTESSCLSNTSYFICPTCSVEVVCTSDPVMTLTNSICLLLRDSKIQLNHGFLMSCNQRGCLVLTHPRHPLTCQTLVFDGVIAIDDAGHYFPHHRTWHVDMSTSSQAIQDPNTGDGWDVISPNSPINRPCTRPLSTPTASMNLASRFLFTACDLL